ncbi:hypothetical protein Ctob_006463 [Chrysochromulina tobinii]|uniref:Uncharacterized protein n=1 Tax=Chrysochromulina tobinii TaxID=1460289 RepID=A0A0M0K8T9_9EUKA|nr:hypothetical protein Ctob_006463 [Chrysochromulina tobinii]|eukprot:KOO35276.1 hypothetical protein Ctob_006463 [Chrysochromulina sp. CCMP291]
MVIKYRQGCAASRIMQWSVTGNFKYFYDMLGFPGAVNTSAGDGMQQGSTRTTLGFGEPMTDTLITYDKRGMSMTHEMTQIPPAMPMSKCVVRWSVLPDPGGSPIRSLVVASASIMFTGAVRKGHGMPEPDEPPFATYDGMKAFWENAFAGWTATASEMAAKAMADTVPLLPPEPDVAPDAPPEECGGTIMSAVLAAAVRQVAAYLTGIDEGKKGRMEAQATIHDVTKAKKVAEEKAAASSRAMTKAQEHERETQLAYIAAAKVMRASVGDSEAVEPAPATEPASPAPGNLAKSKSKKSMKDLSPTKSPSKKSVADAESPSKSPSKKSVADMERAKAEEVATLEAWDKAKDELEQATARWKRDSELSTKSAAQYAELVARMKLYETEDEFKASQAQKLKRAIELDAMMPDDGS